MHTDPSPNMKETDLQQWVEEISIRDFNRPFRHRACFNPRLRTTGGRYFLSDHRIEISPRHLAQLGEEVMLGIIRHELCHYHLHLEGKGYRHRDRDFKELLQKVEGLRYTPPLTAQPYRYVLLCLDCNQKAYRKKRMNPARYRCGHCQGKLVLQEIEGLTPSSRI